MSDYVAREYHHRQYTRDELDLAASREVFYQWINGRKFQNTPAALARCLLNLVIERPEKLMEARRLQAGQRGSPATNTSPTSLGQSTAIRSSSPGEAKRQSTPTPLACVLQELTRQSYYPTQNLEPSPHGSTYNASAQQVLCASCQPVAGPIGTAA